jgi:O-antigen/teichoic acid export membrane protein
MIRASMPYLLSSVFLIVYAEISTVIVSLIVDETAVGWFGTAYRLVGPLLFIPTIFMTAAFPALARQAADGTNLGINLLRRSFGWLIILAVPLGLGILAIASPLIALMYGPAFANSGPVLAIFGITLIFLYQNVLIGQYLISIDRQNVWTLVMAIATVARIGLDLVLVPLTHAWFQNAALGAAIGLTITELAMLVTGLLLLPRGTLGRPTAWLTVRTLIAGAGMLLVIWPLRTSFIGLPIGVAMVTYAILIWVLRLVSPEDQRAVLAMGQSMLARLRRSAPEPTGAN